MFQTEKVVRGSVDPASVFSVLRPYRGRENRRTDREAPASLVNEVLDTGSPPRYLWHRYDLQKEADQLKHKLSPIEFETYRGDRLPRSVELFLKHSADLRGYTVEEEFSTPVCTLASADVYGAGPSWWTGVNARQNDALTYLLDVGLIRRRKSHYAICSTASTHLDDYDYHTVTPTQVVVPGSIIPAQRWNASYPYLPIVALNHLEQYRGNDGAYEGGLAVTVRIGFLFSANRNLVTMTPEIAFTGQPFFLQDGLPGDRAGELSRHVRGRHVTQIPWVHIEGVDTFGLEDWRPNQVSDE